MKKQFKQPSPGDLVEVKINDKVEKGKYLESHDRGVVLLKLDSGYNIGLKKEDISEINVIEKFEVKKGEMNAGKSDKSDSGYKMSGKKPIIDFYLVGGTISSKLDPSTGGVKNLISSKEFFSVYPEIFDIADVNVKAPFSKMSEDMVPADWVRIAKHVGKSLNDPHVKGVIISHGTDTLHFTAAALSFMFGKLNKPVVLTYSQRSSDRGSSDSRLNLLCAAHTSLSDMAEVMIVGHATSNDDYCFALQGNKCRKMHSSRRDAFRPINCKPFVKIWKDGKIETLRDDFNKRNKDKVVVDAVFDDNVSMLKVYPGCNSKVIDYFRKNFKGLVVEGTGLGHVSTNGKFNLVSELKKAIDKGLLVYMTPQTIYGRVDPFVYSNLRKINEAGVVFLEDILPETAYVKLGWVLGHKMWRGSVATKKKMLENVSGEFNNRLGNDFLN
jgi:glutamyl-tRNA(Gln) amidotransferase subunit D